MAKKPKKSTAKKSTTLERKPFTALLPESLPFHPIAMVFGVSMLLGFVVFSPFLFGGELFIFKDIGSDTLNVKYPNLVHLNRYLQQEGFPMAWSFYVGMGQNMYSGWLFGFDEFFNWFFGLFTSSVAVKIGWVAWAKVVAICVVSFAWLKTRTTNDWIAFLGGLALGFSGYAIVGGTWYGHDIFVLRGVLVLWGLDLLWTRKMYFLLPLAMYNFGVDPKLFFFFQFALIYFIIRGIELNWKPMDWLKQSALAASLATIGFLGNGTGIVTRISTVVNSPRMSTSATLSDDLSQRPILALHDGGHFLTTWMRTLSNDLLGAGSDFVGWNNYLEAPNFYCSLLILILLPQVLLLGNLKERRLWGIVLGLSLLPLIFPYFRYAIYLFQGDYYKKGLSLMIPLVMVLLGTKSMEVILREKRIHLIGLLVTGAVLLISLHYPYFDGRLELVAAVQVADTFAILLLIGSFTAYHFHKLGKAAPYILLVALLFDLGFNSGYGFHVRDTVSKRELTQRVGYNDYTLEALDFIENQDDGFYRITKDYASANSIHRSLNEGRIMGFYGTTQYSSFNQANYIRFLSEMALIDSTKETDTRWAAGVERNPLLYPFGGVDYLLRKTEVTHPILANSYQPIGTIEGINIYKNQHRFPFGAFYDSAISEDTLLAMSETQRAIQVYNHVVLGPDDLSSTAKVERINTKNLTVQQFQQIIDRRAAAGTFYMSSFGQNRIEGTLEAPSAGWLFFTIPFDEGWQAKVGGQKVAPVRAQLGFTAIPVDAGANQGVELYFVPPGSKKGIMASLAALALFLGIGFIDYRRVTSERPSSRSDEGSGSDESEA